MRKPIRRLLAAALAAAALVFAVPFDSLGEGFQDCHRARLTYTDTKYNNKSQLRLWQADTVLDSVDEEINSIARGYADALSENLPAAKNTGDLNSRLDVEIRMSRTGLTWMSFMVQARTSFHRKLTAQSFQTRTYDMTTGERVLLTDIFDPGSGAWDLLRETVRDTIETYFPDEAADPDELTLATSDDGLTHSEFTLHGMSLVLHYPAERFYPGRFTLIEVTLFYPEISSLMTERARTETDNSKYYKTCALTFDDGPSRTNTTKVLTALMEAGERGTFFVIGNRIKNFVDQVQREHDHGHAIAMHNWSHADVRKISASTLRANVAKCDKALISAIGIKARYDRVPYGLYPQMAKAKVGWPYIQWSLDTYDWRGRSTKSVMSNVKKQIEDGDILLLHDIKDKTPATTAAIVEYLQEQGYLLLTLDELFAKDGVELTPDKVYYRCQDGDTTKKSRKK